MKKTNKILSVFLALLMIVSIIPMSSITASAVTYSGNCGSNLTWTYDSDTYTLTISGTGAMYDYYSSLDIPWYNYSHSIKTIVINEGVTTIGAMAFCMCKNVTNVTLPNTITTIRSAAFFECSSLSNITFPDSITSIGIHAFTDCTSLTSVFIPGSVSLIGDRAFAGCTNITEFAVDSNNKHYSVDEYGVLFNKDKTTLVQYPIGNTRTSYKIPDTVTTICEYTFSWCDSLANITIPDSVTTIGAGAFGACTSLTSIAIPDGVTTIETETFAMCENITVVTIPKSVKSIGLGAFYQCLTLSEVYYSGTEAQWKEIETDFSYNEPLFLATIHYNHTEHTDNDDDGYCDECSKFFNPSVGCNHNCHKGGISGFFWKITLFFNKLFRTNKYCECGIAHY